jgi:ketosteroid isomerase-like protein
MKSMDRPEHPSATLIRQAVDALNRGDVSSTFAAFADDIEWHEIGRAEAIRGREALASRFAEMPPDRSMHLVLHDILVSDEHAVALLESSETLGGRSITYRTAEIYHVRDHRIAARWAFSDDTQRIAAFFGREDPPKVR